MSDACYCDYEPVDFYERSQRRARKEHRCLECRKAIRVGEVYEYVASKFEGELLCYKTCPRCLAVRQYVTAHVPCFCWYHSTMLEDADNEMREYAHEVPGMGMEYGRLRVAVERGR